MGMGGGMILSVILPFGTALGSVGVDALLTKYFETYKKSNSFRYSELMKQMAVAWQNKLIDTSQRRLEYVDASYEKRWSVNTYDYYAKGTKDIDNFFKWFPNSSYKKDVMCQLTNIDMNKGHALLRSSITEVLKDYPECELLFYRKYFLNAAAKSSDYNGLVTNYYKQKLGFLVMLKIIRKM